MYDGADFSGWQIQPNAVTIQELLQKNLSTLLKESVTVIGSGRTDAGVHARRQVAHFHTLVNVHSEKIQRAMNGLLPSTIRLWQLQEAPQGFHARYSAQGKIYHYHLTLGPIQSPFSRGYRWHVRSQLDIDAMRSAAAHLTGTLDFTSFANEPGAGSVARNPVRTVYRLDFIEDAEGVRMEIEGNGFLYKMVRNIVGTLVDVGKGKLTSADVVRILKARDRRQGSTAAPPHGLFLVDVFYPEPFAFQEGV